MLQKVNDWLKMNLLYSKIRRTSSISLCVLFLLFFPSSFLFLFSFSMAPPSSYPIAGIVFFIAHPQVRKKRKMIGSVYIFFYQQLWLKTLCPFLLTLLFGLVSLILSFVYLLPLQAHALIDAHCPSWLAWIVSVIFVLLESALMDLIFFAIILPIFQDALFDATLRARGLDRMFATRIEVSNLLLCCRGISSGLAMVWFLILAQVQLKKKKNQNSIQIQTRF